jgi:hypothetical protein
MAMRKSTTPTPIPRPAAARSSPGAGFRISSSTITPTSSAAIRLYDHTSILRFIEWRFLGAPARGRGRRGASWYLTARDRHARNLGWSLLPAEPDPEFDTDGFPDPGTSTPCGAPLVAGAAAEENERARALEYAEGLGYRIGTWLPGR